MPLFRFPPTRRLLFTRPLHLLSLLPLRIPLARLQHQNPHKHQREYRVTSRQNLQTIIPAQWLFLAGRHSLDADRQLPLHKLCVVFPTANNAQPLDDIGHVNDHTTHVKDERGAVEKHVWFGGAVKFDEEAEEADGDDDVQDARDDGGGGVQELKMGF